MNSEAFTLDPRLAADTRLLASLPLCDVRLMDYARYGWLVLVPRHDGLGEIADLGEDEQITLWREVNLASRALRAVMPCDKLNLGALGNIVRQLHLHVVARCEGDAGWPCGAGYGQRQPLADAELHERMATLRQALAAPG
ncbi:HIT family protein [Rhodanobacter lindaniclasticus]